MGFDADEFTFLNDFIDDFAKNGPTAIDKYKSSLGLKYERILRQKVEKTLSERCSVINELKKELNKLGIEYDLKNNQWLETFIREFIKAGEQSIETYQSKFGIKYSTRLKKAIQSNPTLTAYHTNSKLSALQTDRVILKDVMSSNDVIAEIQNVLNDIGYNKDRHSERLSDFFDDFLRKGFSCLDIYENFFGEYTKTLKHGLCQNIKLVSYNDNLKEKISQVGQTVIVYSKTTNQSNDIL